MKALRALNVNEKNAYLPRSIDEFSKLDQKIIGDTHIWDIYVYVYIYLMIAPAQSYY